MCSIGAACTWGSSVLGGNSWLCVWNILTGVNVTEVEIAFHDNACYVPGDLITCLLYGQGEIGKNLEYGAHLLMTVMTPLQSPNPMILLSLRAIRN